MDRSSLSLMPVSTDDKHLVLQKLKRSIHFERTLTVATSSLRKKNSLGLTLPSWFVRSHGDKVRKFTMLRTESCTEPWPVKLSICFSPAIPQVRFAGGWQAFAKSNGLLEGDLLIFELTAMSEFMVHVIRSTQEPNQNSSPKRRKRTIDSEHSRDEARQPHVESGGEGIVADEEISDGSMTAFNRKSGAVSGSAIAPIPPSCWNDSLHRLPSFKKILTATNVGLFGQASLEIPGRFFREYGNRFHAVIKLQGIHDHSPVQTMACRTSVGKHIRYYLRKEWADFATANRLWEGQQLLFALSADSLFVVRECEVHRNLA